MNKPIPKSLRLMLEENSGAESEARIWATVRQLESEGRTVKNIIEALFKIASARAIEESISEYSRLLTYAQNEANIMLPKMEKIVNKDFESRC